MSTRTQLTTTAATLTVKNRKVKGNRYSDGTYNITLLRLKSDKQARVCWKCDGTGHLPEYDCEFLYNGMCFNCHGSGIGHVYDTDTKAMDAVRRNLTKQRTDAIKAEQARIANETAHAKREAEWNAWLPENTDLVEFVANAYSNDSIPFLNDMHEILHNSTPLSENQTVAVRKMMAEQETQRYGGQPGEKITFTGRIVKTFSGASDYGLYYMVVVEGIDTFQGATFKLTGTAKLHIELQDCDGDIVTIQATVKKHDLYNGTKQTVMLRPKLISQEPGLDSETEEVLASGEPKWAGELHVNLVHQDTYVVYAVNGTKDAYDLLTKLNAVHGSYDNVSSAYLSFYGSEWNRMHFSQHNLSRYGSSDGVLVSLLDRDNTHYAVTDYQTERKIARLTLAQEHLLDDWRKTYGELQLHVQARGYGTHHACQVSGVQRWGCPEWIRMNKPVEALERAMQEEGMAAPYAVLERPAR